MRSKKLPLTNGEQPVVAHYEELRSRVVAGQFRGVRRGLANLQQMGMATWMETVSSCPPLPVTRSGVTISETRLPDERCPALIDILANLALNRFMEVHA